MQRRHEAINKRDVLNVGDGMSAPAPLIRWAGSKRSSLSDLAPFLGTTVGTRYVEPFCGSAAIYFRFGYKKAILADINHHLINFYQCVQRSAEKVYREATAIPRTKRAYYASRGEFNRTTDSLLRASLFYYLNKNCFNGLFRTSKVGEFNVPFSKTRVGEYPTLEAFSAMADALRNATILCDDFESLLLKRARAGDLVFLDPPYSTAKRYPFREYFPGCFSVDDVKRLIGVLNILDDRGVNFVLTFSSNILRDYDFGHWKVRTLRARRNISGFASHRKYVNDIVLTNKKGIS